jgi:hypothetical protein
MEDVEDVEDGRVPRDLNPRLGRGETSFTGSHYCASVAVGPCFPMLWGLAVDTQNCPSRIEHRREEKTFGARYGFPRMAPRLGLRSMDVAFEGMDLLE